ASSPSSPATTLTAYTAWPVPEAVGSRIRSSPTPGGSAGIATANDRANSFQAVLTLALRSAVAGSSSSTSSWTSPAGPPGTAGAPGAAGGSFAGYVVTAIPPFVGPTLSTLGLRHRHQPSTPPATAALKRRPAVHAARTGSSRVRRGAPYGPWQS